MRRGMNVFCAVHDAEHKQQREGAQQHVAQPQP
jgi:hypothetical protein